MAKSQMNAVSGTARHRLKDKKIQIVRDDEYQDEWGSWHSGMRPIHPGKLWAYKRQIGGEAFYTSVMAGLSETVIFFVNWRADLASNDADIWVIEGDTAYKVDRIDTYEGYKRDLALYCATDPTFDFGSVEPYE